MRYEGQGRGKTGELRLANDDKWPAGESERVDPEVVCCASAATNRLLSIKTSCLLEHRNSKSIGEFHMKLSEHRNSVCVIFIAGYLNSWSPVYGISINFTMFERRAVDTKIRARGQPGEGSKPVHPVATNKNYAIASNMPACFGDRLGDIASRSKLSENCVASSYCYPHRQ